MHSIRLDIEDSVFDRVIDFLKILPQNEVRVVEENQSLHNSKTMENSEIDAFSNHTVATIEEWQDEDDIWK